MKKKIKILSLAITAFSALFFLSAFHSSLTSHTNLENSYEVNDLSDDFLPEIVLEKIESSRAPASTRRRNTGGIDFGHFNCVKRSMGKHADERYLALHAVMVRDSYVGRDMTDGNIKNMKRDMIRRLRDAGYCKPGYLGHRSMSPNVQGWVDGSKPLSSRRGFWVFKKHRCNPRYEQEFEQTFGMSYNQARNMENAYRNRSSHNVRNPRIMRGSHYNRSKCVNFGNKRFKACQNLARSCQIEDSFCEGNDNNPRTGGDGTGTANGSDNGSDNGADNGSDNGADNGSDNGADNGSDNGADNGNETGPGSNDGSGHGANGGGGQGAGPGGVGQ